MNPLRYLQLAVVLALLGGGVYLAWSYRNMAADIATADARIEQAEQAAKAAQSAARDAHEAAEALSKEIVSRAEIDAAIRASRQTIHINLDEVQREDPEARSYLSEPIPSRVRDVYTAPPQP